jgi:hypothetical protein
MSDQVVDRERQLVEEIQTKLPEFSRACSADADFVLMHQDAFAHALRTDEIFLLGKAIKYAGLMGKEVRIIPSYQRPS